MAIETLSKIFTKAADDGKSMKDPPHKPVDHTDASIRQTPQPGRTEYIPTPHTDVNEYEEGVKPENFQKKVHRSPSGPHTIPPEVTIPSPRVNTVQPPRVEMVGPSSNLRSRGNKKSSHGMH